MAIISPELITVDTEYTFTVNPSDDFQFFKEIGSERIKKAQNHMTYIIRQNPNVKINLQLEISRTGRLHWHGTLMFKHLKHVTTFFLETIPDLLTKHHIEIDTIADKAKWKEYCLKQKHLIDVNLYTDDLIKNLGKPRNKVFKDISEY